MVIRITHHGDFKKTEKFLNNAKSRDYHRILDRYANLGLSLLRSATPKDSGVTSSSWSYKIFKQKSRFGIQWFNRSSNGGIPIVILLQYGHGTTGGTFVEGRDFINPVMRPLFEQISDDIWKEVTGL